jgi:hypothetical protein
MQTEKPCDCYECLRREGITRPHRPDCMGDLHYPASCPTAGTAHQAGVKVE